MIEVKNLTKRYGDHTAVDSLSFSVPEGQVFGFLGPNGAGKSTTLNIVTGCLAATAGEVTIAGYDISYPVVFDWEIVGGSDARTYTVSRQALCAATRAFCGAVEDAGYEPMLYFTRYLGYRKYILRNLADYGFWYAEYEDRPRIAFDFDMWQYSETGQVDGIDGNVDLNLYFVR